MKRNSSPVMVSVKILFITRMQKYSGQREVLMELPSDPRQAVDSIIERFDIPWKGSLEKSTRVFINKTLADVFIGSGKDLHNGDAIAFIPISGGG